MANGGHWHSEADWQRAEVPLLQLDDSLTAFAKRFGLQLTKNHKDWPERSLQWGESIRKLIQIYLADERTLTFNVCLCASQDRRDKRYWKQEFVVAATPVSEFSAAFDALLLEAKARLDSWSEAHLEFATTLD